MPTPCGEPCPVGRGTRIRTSKYPYTCAPGSPQSQAPVSNRAVRPYERRLGSQRPPAYPCVPPTGIEPAASTLGTSRSGPLSYGGMCIQLCRGPMGSRTPHVRLARRDCAPAPSPFLHCERIAGIEPAFSVWKTDVSTQPHQIRTAADAGLEPALSDRESDGLPIAQSATLNTQSGTRESNSVCPAPKAGGSTSSLAPEVTVT